MNRDTFEDIRDKLACVPMGKPALIGIVVVLIMVAVLAGKHINDTATAIEFPSQGVTSAVSSEAAEASGAASEPQTIFVHVSGAVNDPGLCEVESGSRLAQAIEAAGGFAEDADIDSVNLARIVADGEQIYVLSKAAGQSGDDAGEAPWSGGDGGGGGPATGGGSADDGAVTGAGGGSASQTGVGVVNLNTATQADLETLPGIGPSTAAKIIADRAANGPFSSVDDLMRVSGIGEKKLEALRGLVTI